MKIWINDTQTQTHRIVKLFCEEHSLCEYFGDLEDEELKNFLVEIKEDIDVEKNMKLLKYFGYLHIFASKKS
jgi:hypothetical protein